METQQSVQAKAQFKVESFEGNEFIDFTLKLKLDETALVQNNSRQKNYQIVIDNSGSMDGTNIQLTKQLCNELVQFVIKTQPHSKISLMTFNTSIDHVENLHLKSLKQVEQFISNINANGGTIFHITFDKLRDICQKFTNQNEELVIVYLTDGQVQSGQDSTNLKDSFIFLQQVLKKFVNNVEVHALGMGTSHDPVILDKIISLQTTQSTYQFIKESSEIEGAFKNIVDIIGQNFIEAYLQRKDGQLCRIPLLKSAIDVSQKQKNCVLIDNDLKEKIFYNSKTKDLVQELESNFQLIINLNHTTNIEIPHHIKDKRISKMSEGDSKQLFEQINQMYNYLETKLKLIIQELKEYVNQKRTSIEKEQIVKFSNQINQINSAYSSSISKLFKLSSLQRQKINENNPTLSTRIKEAVDIVSKLSTSTISTIEIALLNQLAYPTITNRLFAKRLEKRKGASIQQFNDYEILKEKYLQEFQSKEQQLSKDLSQLSQEIGVCFLSCQDITESILNKDCLCVTFSVTRSELAIVRPESLKIKAVQPSIISAKSFIDCIKYSLDISLENSGSFNKQQGNIVQGMMREVINAAMPLYIHKEHWNMAKLWLEPILGWVVTLDPLGYHHAQKRTIPFMLLNHTIRQLIEYGITKYGLKQIDLIFQTCSQIIKEEEQDSVQLQIENSQALKIREEIIKQYEGFMQDASQRLGEKITNIEIFLAKLYIAKTLDWIQIKKDDIKTFFRYVIEEQLRRNMSEYYLKFPILSLIQLFDGNNVVFTNMNNEFLNNLSSTLSIVHYYRFLFEGFNEQDSINKSINITQSKIDMITLVMADNIDQVKALFAQNTIQGQDKVRRSSIGLKKYFDPYSQEYNVLDAIKEIQKQEQVNKVSYVEEMASKSKHKLNIKGQFYFTCPDISKKLQDQMDQLAENDNINDFKIQLEQMSQYKQDRQWYLWYLISKQVDQLKEKLLVVKEKFGPFKKFKKYQIYCLTKGGYLNSSDITELETP
ncbi:von willebrand factor type A domain protein (macronuclear) [Tetrahymena thermophila SB210]|uniref:von willebrand factor type A domain protein n=1 Tax=Tetrahymena thermophila (strain SB210) TaxID=312017 RepID=Q22G03_TETTS|nr:von willebrand factor type A domain protein [Tetrahymena thermophila SB210]EAR84223.1 von willebrand factor type A domain protein [Tetrahymena thermophila SB210]|eukprot:XP_001031886.1 von willebrand factor type A domain protein [Tetrahymena thermophila SB210]